MFVIYELEVREGEFLLYHPGEFGLDGLCPLTDKDNELVDGPSNTAPGNLGVISLELCFFACSLGAEIFLCPNVTMQMRIASAMKKKFMLRVMPTEAETFQVRVKEAAEGRRPVVG